MRQCLPTTWQSASLMFKDGGGEKPLLPMPLVRGCKEACLFFSGGTVLAVAEEKMLPTSPLILAPCTINMLVIHVHLILAYIAC